MTQLVVPMTHPRVSPIVAALRTLAVGALGGFALGVGARAWMRLIADQPDFTWNGTLFIVIGFTIFGFAQSITAVAARSARHRVSRIAARVVGVIGLLPLFVGAGSIMLPTVVAGGFANARRSWPTPARVVCWVIAGGPVLLVAKDIVDEFGWSVHAFVGIALMIALYWTVIHLARFTFASGRNGGPDLA